MENKNRIDVKYYEQFGGASPDHLPFETLINEDISKPLRRVSKFGNNGYCHFDGQKETHSTH